MAAFYCFVSVEDADTLLFIFGEVPKNEVSELDIIKPKG